MLGISKSALGIYERSGQDGSWIRWDDFLSQKND